jgi:hypothetical protein
LLHRQGQPYDVGLLELPDTKSFVGDCESTTNSSDGRLAAGVKARFDGMSAGVAAGVKARVTGCQPRGWCESPLSRDVNRMYIGMSALAYFELAGSEAGARWCGEFLRIVSDLRFSTPPTKNAVLSSALVYIEFMAPRLTKRGFAKQPISAAHWRE